MIVSFNFYYARPGLQDAVLQQRLRACEVRQSLAIPRGRVLARASGAGELPDVIWEQQFTDVDGHLADMAVRAASAEFESIRAGMRKLYHRFERPLFQICGNAPAELAAPAGSHTLVTLDWIFCRPESTEHLVERLEQHAAHNAAPHSGRTRLLRLITPGDDLPELVWQHEYAGADPQKASQSAIVGRNGQTWQSTVAALAPRVEHSAWTVTE